MKPNGDSKKLWKIISNEYLHKNPWLTVRKGHVVLPNGNHTPSYYTLEHPNWVDTIAITRDGQFVFVRQHRHGLRKTSYEFCTDVCEKGDASPLVSAQRESLEKTDHEDGIWREFVQIPLNPGTHANVTYCFLATDAEKVSKQRLEDTESLSVHLLTLMEVKELLEKGEIEQTPMAVSLWKYIAEKGLQILLEQLAEHTTALPSGIAVSRSFFNHRSFSAKGARLSC